MRLIVSFSLLRERSIWEDFWISSMTSFGVENVFPFSEMSISPFLIHDTSAILPLSGSKPIPSYVSAPLVRASSKDGRKYEYVGLSESG